MNLGTSLPVVTTADQWPVFVAGMGDPVRPIQEKRAPDGRIKLNSGGLLRVARKDGTIATDKSASVHVINAPEGGQLEFGQLYRAEGLVWVQPYESNQRVALSITVESLVKMGSADSVPVAAAAAPAAAAVGKTRGGDA